MLLRSGAQNELQAFASSGSVRSGDGAGVPHLHAHHLRYIQSPCVHEGGLVAGLRLRVVVSGHILSSRSIDPEGMLCLCQPDEVVMGMAVPCNKPDGLQVLIWERARMPHSGHVYEGMWQMTKDLGSRWYGPIWQPDEPGSSFMVRSGSDLTPAVGL